MCHRLTGTKITESFLFCANLLQVNGAFVIPTQCPECLLFPFCYTARQNWITFFTEMSSVFFGKVPEENLDGGSLKKKKRASEEWRHTSKSWTGFQSLARAKQTNGCQTDAKLAFLLLDHLIACASSCSTCFAFGFAGKDDSLCLWWSVIITNAPAQLSLFTAAMRE